MDRTVQVTHGAGGKVVASNQPLRLPAGLATLTTTVEVERTNRDGRTTSAGSYAAAFERTRVEGQIAFNLPLSSRIEGLMPWLGDLRPTARSRYAASAALARFPTPLTSAPQIPLFDVARDGPVW